MSEPEAVQRAKERNPTCAFSREFSSMTTLGSEGLKSTSQTRYYMTCPGDSSRKLLASTDGASSSKASADALSLLPPVFRDILGGSSARSDAIAKARESSIEERSRAAVEAARREGSGMAGDKGAATASSAAAAAFHAESHSGLGGGVNI